MIDNFGFSPLNHSQKGYLIESLPVFLNHLSLVMPLINTLNNITFFIKNKDARYQIINDNFAKRCQITDKKKIIGKLAEDVFEYDLGRSYSEQDHQVMQAGKGIFNQLELHSYQSGALGWCITSKLPIYNYQQEIVGVAGISIDLQDVNLIRPSLNAKLSLAEKHIRLFFNTALKVQDLANIAELSITQLERQFKVIFQMTPQQMIQKKRLEHAIKLLGEDKSITEISASCGYTDHSAFTRKFKELTKLTPTQFKKKL